MSADTIRGAIAAFREAQNANRTDSLFTVDKVQSRFYRADCSPVNHDPDNLVRTQDLEPWFEENSNLYIFTGDSFAATNARIGRKPMMYEGPQFESIDIDTPQRSDEHTSELQSLMRIWFAGNCLQQKKHQDGLAED